MPPWEKYKSAAPAQYDTNTEDGARKAYLDVFDPPEEVVSASGKPWERYKMPPAVSISPEEAPKMPPEAVLTAEQAAQVNPDFYQRVGQAMLKRGQNVGKQVVQGATGQQGWAETGANTLGNAAGLLFDVGAEGVKSAFKTLPEAVQQPVKSAGGYVADSAVGDVAGDYARRYGKFAENNPRASALVDTVANLSGLSPATKAAEAGASAVKPIAEATSEAMQMAGNKIKEAVKLPERAVRPQPIMPNDLAQAKTNAYKYTMDTGSAINGNGTNKLVDVLEGYREKPSFEGTWLSDESAAINEAIDKFKNIRGKKGDIESIQKFDSDLGDMAASAYVAGERNKGRIFSNMQDDIREKLLSGELKNDVIGSPEGIKVLFEDAIPLAATEFKLLDIKKVIDKGMSTTTPTRSVQTGLNNLMANDKKFKRLPKEVQAEIAKAAKSGNFDDLLSIVGSRLNAIGGGAAGGVKGAAVGYAVGKAGRSIRDRMMLNKTNKIYDKLLEPVRGSVERFRTMPEAPKQPTRLLEYRPKPVDYIADSQGRAAAVQTTPQQAISSVKAISGKENAVREKVSAGIAEQAADRAKERVNREAFAKQVFSQQGRPLALPAPNKVSPLPLSKFELKKSQAINNKTPEVGTGGEPLPNVIKTPVSRKLQIEQSANWIQGKQFKNLEQRYLKGQLSKNQFVGTIQRTFKITREQARDLADEISNYSKSNQE